MMFSMTRCLFILEIDLSVTGNCQSHPRASLRRGTWNCLSMHCLMSDLPGSHRLKTSLMLDGAFWMSRAFPSFSLSSPGRFDLVTLVAPGPGFDSTSPALSSWIATCQVALQDTSVTDAVTSLHHEESIMVQMIMAQYLEHSC